MKRDFTHENFEDFLKRSADSLRMKAPDKVWQNLSRDLNKRKRRVTFGLSAFLMIAATAGYFITAQVSPNANLSPGQNGQSTIDNITPLVKKEKTQQTTAQAQFFRQNTSPVSTTTEKPNNTIAATSNSNPFPGDRRQNQETLVSKLTGETSVILNDFTPTVVDSYTEFDAQQTPKKEGRQIDLTNTAAFPLTIESVLNSYKGKIKKGKLEKQFYFAPTISYRKLAENKSYLRTLSPSNMPANFPSLTSTVNNNVTHKPDVGFEVGYALKYPLSAKLKLRSGLQFNVNRYDVKAFSSPLSIATIALNNGPTFSTISGYSNVYSNGYRSNWLQNLSFQVSAPVGVEYTLSNTDKMKFGVATTVQPTYVLGDRAYLITTDYKSYTQVPWLIRRWNVNTSVETFVSFKTGNTQLQVGPQMRYQLLSSFISKYPVKENLFDFGLKVGISLNK